MAKRKKNNEELPFLNMPLPKAQPSTRSHKTEWMGLNKRGDIDVGSLSDMSNISYDEAPYIIPSQVRKTYFGKSYARPISMFGLDDFLLVVYRSGLKILIDYITEDNIFTGTIKESDATTKDEFQRSIVKFNTYDIEAGHLDGTTTEKLLIFPDKKSIDFKISSNNFDVSDLDDGINVIPDMKYVTVHNSRLFGVNDGMIYASGFNNYANWNVDTVDDYSPDNAWFSAAQANTKASGKFTAITTFSNHVIAFKNDYTHEIYNNKNPFRIQDIFAEGCIDSRSIADVGGRLFFANETGIKNYTGGKPRDISYNLNLDKIRSAIAGTDGRKYYLYCETNKYKEDDDDYNDTHLFVYDTLTDQWSEESINFEIKSFAYNDIGMFALGSDGNIHRIDTKDYESQEWYFETSLNTGGTNRFKRIQNVNLIVELETDAEFSVHCLYDGEKFDTNTSHKVCYFKNSTFRKKLLPVRVIPRSTSNFAFNLRFSGSGYVKIYQMELFLQGGDSVYVSK